MANDRKQCRRSKVMNRVERTLLSPDEVVLFTLAARSVDDGNLDGVIHALRQGKVCKDLASEHGVGRWRVHAGMLALHARFRR